MFAWFAYNSNRQTHSVAQKWPNAWGLYDMIGNVQEWCNDWYQEGYAPGSAVNPTGPATGTERVNRGGDYYGNPTTGGLARSATRKSRAPDGYAANLGFRCVLSRK
jgi:formylglycine-generating enzyme required for sulfatase activity